MTNQDIKNVSREAGYPPMPPRTSLPGFSLLRHRTLTRYLRVVDEQRRHEHAAILAWSRECSERRLALFDRYVESLGFEILLGPDADECVAPSRNGARDRSPATAAVMPWRAAMSENPTKD